MEKCTINSFGLQFQFSYAVTESLDMNDFYDDCYDLDDDDSDYVDQDDDADGDGADDSGNENA